MANRRFTSQFNYSFEKQPVTLAGAFTQSGSTGTFAVLVSNSITYTAKTMGAAGNDITIALIAGGTAGAEVVTVSAAGAISVQIESGVSTRTQVKTAIDGNTAAALLISVSVSSGGTAATLSAAAHLATGTSTVFTNNCPLVPMTLTQIDTGVFQLALTNSYQSLLGFDVMIQKASAADVKPQLKSNDPTTTKLIIFRIIAVATPTNLATGDVLFIKALLRNE